MAGDRPPGVRAHTKQGNLAVLDTNQAISLGNHPLVVGGEDEGGLEFPVDSLHQEKNFLARPVVEVGRWFVRQDDRRANRQRSGDRHALTLAATQLIRPMVGVFRKADDIEEVCDASLPLFTRQILAVKQRIFDVFGGREHGQQIERLEDEADGSRAQVGQLVGRPSTDILVVDIDLAAGWRVNAADQIQQGGLATARRSGDRQKNPGIEGQGNILQGLDFLFAKQIILVYVFYADNLHAVAFPANRVYGQHIGVKTMEIMTIRHCGVNCALVVLTAAMLAGAAPGRAAEAIQPASGDDAEARMIVEKADQVRFPADGFQVDVTITTIDSDQGADVRKYRVLSKGNTNSVVMVTEPASERGQILLMKGRDLWVFMPDVSQPIRLALSQRLTGQVANGDLARANFAGDYNPRLLRTEKVGNDEHYVLELTGADRGVTYQRVVYWVREKDYWPHKAEFYSLSNRLLKTCRYENFKTMEGRKRPTRLVMEDALRGGEQSVLEYAGMKLRDLPDKIFTKDYLKKLE